MRKGVCARKQSGKLEGWKKGVRERGKERLMGRKNGECWKAGKEKERE